jgi:tyrocidine synthetase-3
VLAIETEKISVKDNFFEIGGHSLKATRLASQIHKEFEIKMELKDVFTEATIESIASKINTLLWVKNIDSESQEDVNDERFVF